MAKHLPNIKNALTLGEISHEHAKALVKEAEVLIQHVDDVNVIEYWEKAAILACEERTPNGAANKIRSITAQIAPEAFEDKVRDSILERRVIYTPQNDGMASIWALLPAAEAQAFIRAIEHHARRKRFKLSAEFREEFRKNHSKKVNHLSDGRGDVSGEHVSESGDIGGDVGGDVGGDDKHWAKNLDFENEIEGALNLTYFDRKTETQEIFLESASGIDGAKPRTIHDDFINRDKEYEFFEYERAALPTLDQLRADAFGEIAHRYLAENIDEPIVHNKALTVNVTVELDTLTGKNEKPANLEGYGPIPASIARELAIDANWRNMVVEKGTGNLLNFGRNCYLPPKNLVDFIIARDQRCRFPGCRQLSYRNDIDHAQPWENGGETNPDNLGSLCRRHHRLKTSYGWKLKSEVDGSCTWTSPRGKIYSVSARSVFSET